MSEKTGKEAQMRLINLAPGESFDWEKWSKLFGFVSHDALIEAGKSMMYYPMENVVRLLDKSVKNPYKPRRKAR